MKKAEEFIVKCKSLLASDSNLFWVAFQSNVLADMQVNVQDDFQKAFKETKEELEKKGWILPTLEANMRNQVNIANINVEGNSVYARKMQSSINLLPSASSVVGEIPSLVNIESEDWDAKKEELLRHCIEKIQQKSDKNIVILHDDHPYFKDLEKTLKKVIKNKTILTYPSPFQNKPKNVQIRTLKNVIKNKQNLRYPSPSQNKKQNVQNVLDFTIQNNHILVTKYKYFNGCEACNLIYLNSTSYSGVRNPLMRASQNVILIQVGVYCAKIKGMKEDNSFC